MLDHLQQFDQSQSWIRQKGADRVNIRQLFIINCEAVLTWTYVIWNVQNFSYTMLEMHSVVADVRNYYKFVPYVKHSHVHDEKRNGFKADLIIGFPPINESYTSNVRIVEPTLVTSECRDGRLFNYLLNEWRFSPGLKDIPQSCVVDFKVAFEFKSLFHAQIANLFFDFLCHQMESAFVAEAKRRYGEASIKSYLLYSRRTWYRNNLDILNCQKIAFNEGHQIR